MGEIKLNLGCGGDIKPGYVNIDIRVLPGVDYIADVRKLGYPDGSVDEIIAKDLLEHFPFPQAQDILKEWARVLKKGGRIYIQCPDLRRIAERYLGINLTPPMGHKLDCRMVNWLLMGGQCVDGSYHLACFDCETLEELCKQAGLRKISCESDGGSNINSWWEKA